MGIQTFGQYMRENFGRIDNANLKNAAALYSLYILWLFKKCGHKQANTSVLLMQLRAVNTYILTNEIKTEQSEADVSEAYVKAIGEVSVFVKIFNSSTAPIGEPIPMIFLPRQMIALGVLVAITLPLLKYLGLALSPLTMGISALVSSFIVAPLIHFGYNRFVEYRNRDNPEQAKLQASCIAPSMKNEIFKDRETAQNADYESLIQKTTLALYETKYPRNQPNSNDNEAVSEDVDLGILSQKLTQGV